MMVLEPLQSNSAEGEDISSTTPRALAIIPARGGSKGVVGKNLRVVAGQELLARAIQACRDSSQIGLVIVSTDDVDIARVARREGAEVVIRPADLASDTATSEAALTHVLHDLELRGENVPDITVFVQCTSPFVRGIDLDGAIDRMRNTNADTVMAVVESHRFIWQYQGSRLVGVNHDGGARKRRQDLAPEYCETGAFYVLNTKRFKCSGNRFMETTIGFEVPAWTAIEIDSEEDLELAGMMAGKVNCGPICADALVTDFDGVHTDNGAYVSESGEEMAKVTRTDGMGIAMLRDADTPILILSKEQNPIVVYRAEKLRVDVRHGIDDKLPVLREWINARGLDPRKVAYVGNDINDVECMGYVGWPIAVADAHPTALAAARIVLRNKGGEGAVREVTDGILEAAKTSAASTTGLPSVDGEKRPLQMEQNRGL